MYQDTIKNITLGPRQESSGVKVFGDNGTYGF